MRRPLSHSPGQNQTQLRHANSALAQWRTLFQRAIAVYHEGGMKLVARRFHRWLDHQQGRYRPSKAYQQWIRDNEPSLEELQRQKASSLARAKPTLISIVCPLHKTPIETLEQTIQSVQSQTYSHWELCLAFSEKETAQLWKTLRRFELLDPRIKIVPLEENLGIAANTNAAIRSAQGEWIAFLDHDDLLAPNALYEAADVLERQPECDLIYTDEDLLSAQGGFRKSPMLKPDWSPEMLLGFNYICHFVVARKSLIEKVGGLRPAYDGAQDWDLLLRIAEQTDRIHHIPKILYHWRESRDSTAGDPNAKPYVAKAQESVLRDCLSRRQIHAQAQRNRLGHYRLKWKATEDSCISIIIPNRNHPNLIIKVVEGILYETSYQNTEIIIVDNQSTDPEVLKLYRKWRSTNRVQVINYAESFNYSKACNLGAAAARGEFLLFLNNDVEIIHKDWLSELLGWGKQPDTGIVGGHLIYPDGRTQHAGIVLGLFELAGHMLSASPAETASSFGRAEWIRNVSAVTGACQLISRDLFERLGGYDESYHLVYSDVDLCLRAGALGHRIIYTPHCRLIHHECSTRAPGNNDADARRFAEKVRMLGITSDPYYHPALSAHARCPQFKSKTSRNVAENLMHRIHRTLKRTESDLVPPENEFAQFSWE